MASNSSPQTQQMRTQQPFCSSAAEILGWQGPGQSRNRTSGSGESSGVQSEHSFASGRCQVEGCPKRHELMQQSRIEDHIAPHGPSHHTNVDSRTCNDHHKKAHGMDLRTFYEMRPFQYPQEAANLLDLESSESWEPSSAQFENSPASSPWNGRLAKDYFTEALNFPSNWYHPENSTYSGPARGSALFLCGTDDPWPTSKEESVRRIIAKVDQQFSKHRPMSDCHSQNQPQHQLYTQPLPSSTLESYTASNSSPQTQQMRTQQHSCLVPADSGQFTRNHTSESGESSCA